MYFYQSFYTCQYLKKSGMSSVVEYYFSKFLKYRLCRLYEKMGTTKLVSCGKMMMSDELHKELSSRKDQFRGTGGEKAASSLVGVDMRIIQGTVLTRLIVSLSLSTSVDIRVKNWSSKSLSIYVTVKLPWR